MTEQIRVTLDLEEARACVRDAVEAYCAGQGYEYLSLQAAQWAYLVRASCVLCTEPDNAHAQDAADLVCLGDDLIPFINGLAKATREKPQDVAARIVPALVALNDNGHNVLAVARRHFGVTVDRFPRHAANGAVMVEISDYMGGANG